MNEVMSAILTRRSTRKFIDQPIPEAILKDIVEAALHAPSGMGKQTWQFTMITNKEVISRLADAIGKELDRKGYDIYKPAALLMVSNITGGNWTKEDNACALENAFLAAHSYGVGSVWINQMQNINDRPAIRSILNELGVPSDHSVTGMAALGYADPESPVLPVKRIGKVVYIK